MEYDSKKKKKKKRVVNVRDFVKEGYRRVIGEVKDLLEFQFFTPTLRGSRAKVLETLN